MSKAVIFFAPGLEECEGLLCVDILRRAGVEVTIAAVGGEKIVKSARQISVVADALAEELDYTVFDACILPGGIPGVPNLKADATVRRVCRDFAAEEKSEVETKLSALKEALKSGSVDDIKAKQDDLQKAFYAISEKVYQQAAQAQGQQPGAQPGPDAGAQPKDDGAVDADFHEV